MTKDRNTDYSEINLLPYAYWDYNRLLTMIGEIEIEISYGGSGDNI